MLTEEAHHMFVGQTGVARIVQRTAELMRGGKDPRAEGAIPFDMLQRYLNFWYTVSLDLFGSEVSTNAAAYFGSGLKGRPKEERYDDDHVLLDGAAAVELLEEGAIVTREVAPRLAVNSAVRRAYAEDCAAAVEKWNRLVADLGVELRLPSERFNRRVGTFAAGCFDPAGNVIDADALRRRRDEFLPSRDDDDYVRAIMAHPVTEPGRFANWIAPPSRGIDAHPIDFAYVRSNEA
jgi:benzoyl-CoA 2,3-dioxygenase component B